MKKYYRQAIAFLLVWFCSGVTMYSYQAENKILGITFTLLSFLYWFIIDKDDQENKYMAIGDGKHTLEDSSLKHMTKDELIRIIRCLESNLRNAHETNDIQYENCKRLLNGNGTIQDEYKKRFNEQTEAWIKAGLTLPESDKEELMKMSQLRE